MNNPFTSKSIPQIHRELWLNDPWSFHLDQIAHDNLIRKFGNIKLADNDIVLRMMCRWKLLMERLDMKHGRHED